MELSDVLSSLDEGDRALAQQLADAAMALGFALKTQPDKAGCKCDFIQKPRRTLCSLRERGGSLELNLKLYHIDGYQAAVDACSAPVCAQLAAASNCGAHGGSCKGAVRFTIDGQALSKCRHGLTLRNLTPGDMPCVLRLMELEAAIP